MGGFDRLGVRLQSNTKDYVSKNRPPTPTIFTTDFGDSRKTAILIEKQQKSLIKHLLI